MGAREHAAERLGRVLRELGLERHRRRGRRRPTREVEGELGRPLPSRDFDSFRRAIINCYSPEAQVHVGYNEDGLTDEESRTLSRREREAEVRKGSGGARFGFEMVGELDGVKTTLRFGDDGTYNKKHDNPYDASCSFCGKEDFATLLKKCPCKQAFYCNAECQTAHWKAHKKTCPIQLKKKAEKAAAKTKAVVE